MSKRLLSDIRREEILCAALRVAGVWHYAYMTRGQVAAEAGITGPLVQYYFHTMPRLRRAVMRAAIRRRMLTVIAQGLVSRDVHARGAPLELREAAVMSVLL